MSKTVHLGLTLVDSSNESSTTFQQWQRNINTNGSGEEISDFQKIDNFAGAIYGVNGTAVLLASGWDSNNLTYTLNVPDLGDTDAIFFSPSDATSKANLERANCFIQSNGTSVTFIAATLPTEDISLNYFIARGK